ncbi:helicase-associated domain-containing protein [Desulfonema magnum]|uniref:Helicase XPB/Ssl2 N-terminal domain-containing protein n=1 Tax=Desulfonema magnum TaxID=45655 RepID=A0A975BNL3_9BACT|nr:helicase-associated domain-containing protein [Desulfonema magnum]QTA88999.1 Uncharacterized protein dnm_050440 [Desulfonema magnum]
MRHSDNQLKSLKLMMDNYVVDDLKKIGAYLVAVLKESRIKPAGLKKIPSKAGDLPTKKADRVQWNLTCLRDKSLLKFIYEKKMTSVEQAALQEVVHGNGKVHWEQFRAKYGERPRVTWSTYGYYGYGWGREKEAFVFPPLALFMTSYGMPSDMLNRIKSFVPEPREVEARSVKELPETVTIRTGWEEYGEAQLLQYSTEQAAINDLMVILQLADMGKISVSAKTGRPTKTACKNIRKALSSGDFYPEDAEAEHEYDIQMGDAGIRPFAWTMLLQAGGLVRINGTKLELSRTGRAAMKKPAHDVLKTLFERWLKNKNFHEMSRIDIFKGQKSRKRPLYVAAPSRQKIADALYELAEGVWMTTEDFFEFLIAKGHRFEVVREYWYLYIGEANYGTLGYDHVTWDHVDGRFARAFLLEYAATLGLIDVALIPPWGAISDHFDLWGADEYSCLSRYDGLYGLRLNSLGAWMLGQKAEYTPAFHDEASLRVLPNMDITSLGSASSSDELFLDRFCTRKSERVWHLTLPKLLQAVEEGVDIASIITFLNERNKGPLPQPVEAFLDDAVRRIRMVQDMGDARLIKCADSTMAQLIANDTSLKKLCFLAGKNHIVIPKDKENQFRKGLRKIGYVLNIQDG